MNLYGAINFEFLKWRCSYINYGTHCMHAATISVTACMIST